MNGSRENYLYQLDCQMRREKDPTKKMQIELLMATIKNGSAEVDPCLRRQVDLMTGQLVEQPVPPSYPRELYVTFYTGEGLKLPTPRGPFIELGAAQRAGRAVIADSDWGYEIHDADGSWVASVNRPQPDGPTK